MNGHGPQPSVAERSRGEVQVPDPRSDDGGLNHGLSNPRGAAGTKHEPQRPAKAAASIEGGWLDIFSTRQCYCRVTGFGTVFG
jgi:hypothetical protein